MAERRLPRGLLDPESQAIAEAYEAIPSVRRQTRGLLSLDPQEEQGMGQAAIEMLASFIPGVGQLLAGRDIERARRAGDPAAAAMAATEFLPFGRLAGMMRRPGPIMSEIDVYHGSPHRFEEFDASKIGTGEGAQSYGHGIYLAESPDVAKSYQKQLAQINPEMTVNFELPISGKSKKFAETALKDSDGNTEAAIELLKYNSQFYSSVEAKNAAREAINALKTAKITWEKDYPIGHFYTADLPDEMVDRMLDWDKPFFEQSDEIKKFAKDNLPATVYNQVLMQRSGDMVEELAKYKGGKAKASELMRQAGIPGIKYLDAGSRGQGGSGTRNFVVFPGEEKKVKILKRE